MRSDDEVSTCRSFDDTDRIELGWFIIYQSFI